MNSPHFKILIIDDEESVCAIMAEILRNEPYELFFAANGREGLDRVQELHPDLIFLDMCMPVLNGAGFLRELNVLAISACPVLAITGYDDDVAIDQCFEEGIFSLIRKPFHASEIKAVCRRYTGISFMKKQLAFNLETLNFLSQQAHSYGLDDFSERALIEALPFPVFVKNREQVFIQVNKAFEDFSGLSRAEVLGKTCEAVNAQKQFVVGSHEIEQSLVENGGTFHHEQIAMDRHGVQREVIIYRSAIGGENGSLPLGVLGVMIDVTAFGFASYKKCW